MNFHIKTLGCKMNLYDSEKLADELLKLGLKQKETAENVDFLIVNSCTVTNSADHKSRQAITNLKKQSPQAKVIVIGCGAKKDAKQFQEKAEVDFVSGEQAEILEYLKQAVSHELRATSYKPPNPLFKGERTRANIKIQNGCENYCSYCIIAFVRGKSESVPAQKIIAEIQEKEKAGVREIVLTGINIGAYGASLTTKPQENTFAELLEEILEKTEIPRIRLSSIGPQYFSDKLIQVLNHPRICQHLHLSIQSCSNAVLKKMNRPYTIESVIELAEKLRKVMPDIALTSDIITGFPEETAENHQETLANLQKIQLMKIHIFPYSIREGTVAAKMRQVPHNLKMQRKKDLAELAEKMRADFLNQQIGQTKKVLFENKNKQGFWEGYTDNYIRAQIQSTENLANQIQTIRLVAGNVIF